MSNKTIALPGKARIVRRNGKPREVILPIKEYEALHQLTEDLKDSLEIQGLLKSILSTAIRAFLQGHPRTKAGTLIYVIVL